MFWFMNRSYWNALFHWKGKCWLLCHEKFKNSSAVHCDASVLMSSMGFSHHFFQEPVKKKGRTVTTGKVKEEPSSFLIKPKTKKPVTTKKENQAEKSRCVDLITDGVCRLLFVVFFPPLVLFVCFFYKSLYRPQFSGAAVRNTAGEQTTQELHIQSSLPSHQHPKDETCAETEMWVFFESPLKCRHPRPLLQNQMRLWHVCSDSRWKAGGRAPLSVGQAAVQRLGARARPQQQFWGGEGVCGSRVGRATLQKQHS